LSLIVREGGKLFVDICHTLGTWQLYILQWKLGLIKQREERLSAPPQNLPSLGTPNLQDWEYRPVKVQGTFVHEQEQYLQPRIYVTPKDKQTLHGCHVLTPLQTRQGALLVNRGFVPKTKMDPHSRLSGQIQGETEIVGIARVPSKTKPNMFFPNNEPDKKTWYWIDLQGLSQNTNPPVDKNIYIEAGLKSTPHEGVFPVGVQWNSSLRNNHLEYAITWFTLGACLTVLSILFVRRNTRRKMF